MDAAKHLSRPISRVLSWVIIYLGDRLPCLSSDQTREVGGPRHTSPIRSCSEWGLPGQSAHLTAGALYRTFSPDRNRRYVSVALSLRSPSLGVTQHPALWSSDFPRVLPGGNVPAITRFSHVKLFTNIITELWTENQFFASSALFANQSALFCSRLICRNDTSVNFSIKTFTNK